MFTDFLSHTKGATMSRSHLAISVDLDSTIADTRQRRYVLNNRPKHVPADWLAYSMACSADEVIEGTATLVRALADHHQIFFVSGRNEEARELTAAWLDANDIPWDGLYLKPVGHEWDSQQDYKLKVIRGLEAEHGVRVTLHLDDWQEVVDHLSANGIPAIHVVPPGFTLQATPAPPATPAITTPRSVDGRWVAL